MSRVVFVVALLALVAGARAETCAQYCDLMTTACAGASGAADVFPYLNYAGCLASCDTFPNDDVLFAGNTTGNSLQCRVYHAGVANSSSTAAAAHCLHAAYGGGTQCGSTCEAYCNLMTSATAATRLVTAPFASRTECQEVGPGAFCGNYLSVSTGMTNPAVTAGNTAECRVYHANVGIQLTDTTASAGHFGHALPAPTALGTCTPAGASGNYSSAVEVYCDKIIAACGLSTITAEATWGQYANREQCLRTARFFPRATAVNAQTGNSLDCRLYHAGVAGNAAFKDAHCEHSGANGKAVCGTSCDGFCQLLQGTCTGSNAQFGSVAACVAWCATFPDGGTSSERPYATASDTFQCHIYHAQVASQRQDLANAHCTHAGPTGNNVCGTTARCTAFCRGQILACGVTGTNAQFTSLATCETACATWTPGTFSASTTTGNTLACRAYHATVALVDSTSANNHCVHTGATPTAFCVDNVVASSSGASTSTGSTLTGTADLGAATGVQASIALVAGLAVAVAAL